VFQCMFFYVLSHVVLKLLVSNFFFKSFHYLLYQPASCGMLHLWCKLENILPCFKLNELTFNSFANHQKFVYYLVRHMIRSNVFNIIVFLMHSLEASLLDFGLPHLKTLG
jgi:hypothetical protein